MGFIMRCVCDRCGTKGKSEPSLGFLGDSPPVGWGELSLHTRIKVEPHDKKKPPFETPDKILLCPRCNDAAEAVLKRFFRAHKRKADR